MEEVPPISEQERSGRRPDPPPQFPILRVLVGSRAYGIATDDSDHDERVVFIAPTWKFFEVGFGGRSDVKESLWVEDPEAGDLTGWELGRFVQRAVHCDPNIVQVLWAPVLEETPEGTGLRVIATSFLSRMRVYEAFRGYAANQVKKMLFEPGIGWTVRNWKFAEAYLRALEQGCQLLRSGRLWMDFSGVNPELHAALVRAKHGEMQPGEVVQRARVLEERLFSEYNRSPLPDKPDIAAINGLLYTVRRRGWELGDGR